VEDADNPSDGEGGPPGIDGSAGGHADQEVHSLLELFRERRLSVSSMDRPLRAATAGAAASLLATVLLIALRDVHGQRYIWAVPTEL
jgi:hypothetical protein